MSLYLGLGRSVAKGFPPLPPALMANVLRNMPSTLGGAGAGAPSGTGIDFSIYGGKSASDAAEAEAEAGAGAEGSGLVSRRLWYYVLQKQGIFAPSSRAASASTSGGTQGAATSTSTSASTTKAVGMEMDMGMEAAAVGGGGGTAAATVAPPPASVLWQHVSNHQIAQMARGLLRGVHTVQGKRELSKGLGRGA
jgi:hypothetical protein